MDVTKGTPTGEAFVRFVNNEQARRAASTEFDNSFFNGVHAIRVKISSEAALDKAVADRELAIKYRTANRANITSNAGPESANGVHNKMNIKPRKSPKVKLKMRSGKPVASHTFNDMNVDGSNTLSNKSASNFNDDHENGSNNIKKQRNTKNSKQKKKKKSHQNKSEALDREVEQIAERLFLEQLEDAKKASMQQLQVDEQRRIDHSNDKRSNSTQNKSKNNNQKNKSKHKRSGSDNTHIAKPSSGTESHKPPKKSKKRSKGKQRQRDKLQNGVKNSMNPVNRDGANNSSFTNRYTDRDHTNGFTQSNKKAPPKHTRIYTRNNHGEQMVLAPNPQAEVTMRNTNSNINYYTKPPYYSGPTTDSHTSAKTKKPPAHKNNSDQHNYHFRRQNGLNTLPNHKNQINLYNNNKVEDKITATSSSNSTFQKYNQTPPKYTPFLYQSSTPSAGMHHKANTNTKRSPKDSYVGSSTESTTVHESKSVNTPLNRTNNIHAPQTESGRSKIFLKSPNSDIGSAWESTISEKTLPSSISAEERTVNSTDNMNITQQQSKEPDWNKDWDSNAWSNNNSGNSSLWNNANAFSNNDISGNCAWMSSSFLSPAPQPPSD